MSEIDSSYPRPDFWRSGLRWESLNGSWELLFDDNNSGLDDLWEQKGIPSETQTEEGKAISKRKIQVPFVFQSVASGINEQNVHEVIWYERQIHDIRSDQEKSARYRQLLRFGAVDYHAKAWVNGRLAGEHQGGHVPFDLDITSLLHLAADGQSRLTVRVYDSATALTQPRGKQYWGPKPEDIYYTPSSGIWQSVWLESVPPLRIADSRGGTILRSQDIEGGLLDARIAILGRRSRDKCSVEVEARLGGMVVKRSEKIEFRPEEDFARFNLDMRLTSDQIKQLPEPVLQCAPVDDDTCWRDGIALWSPEHPTLYDLTVRLINSAGVVLDEICISTGMRSIDWTTGDSTFRLNGKPYFHALLLDQGYWPDTLMTPPTPEALKRDIELSKAMGFNGCRKHQKVEDPRFFYWADRMGFLVWGEMASAYSFSVEYADRFTQEWMEMVKRDINHPSLVAWTIANESWGYPDLGNQPRQRDHIRSLYHHTKTLDPTRPINDNCGWEHVVTDLTTFHDYADANGMRERCESVEDVVKRGRSVFLNPIRRSGTITDDGSKHRIGAPVLCTEFGGVNISASHDADRKENWGYTTAKNSEDLLKRVENIIMATIGAGHICGIVWTQLTDIEQEQNGLYTYDRREKLPALRVKEVLQRAKETYLSNRK